MAASKGKTKTALFLRQQRGALFSFKAKRREEKKEKTVFPKGIGIKETGKRKKDSIRGIRICREIEKMAILCLLYGVKMHEIRTQKKRPCPVRVGWKTFSFGASSNFLSVLSL